MGLSALRQAKADDYVRVEYIENTSTAYIQTNIIPNAGTGLKTKANFTDSRDVYFVGLRNDGGNTRWGIGHGGAGFYYCYGNYQGTNRLVDTKGEFYLNYKNDKKFITIDLDDSSTLTSNLPNLSFTPKFGIRIFGAAGNGANTIVKSRIYYLQITQGSEIIRDFIPMYQISTDTYGLWDRVEEKFYTSPNGVKFIGGARVVADADDNLYYLKDYIKCNGTTNTFINLSKFTNLDNVEFEVYSNTAHDNFIGSRSGTPVRNHFQIAKWTNTRIDISFGQQNPASITSKNTGNKKFKIKLWERIIYLDNEKFYTCPNNTFTTNTVVSLGAVKGLSQPTSARFYWFKWWNKDKDLIYDMIPVQRISDGVWGMFCKVHLGFYPSNGSAQFTGG